MDVAEQFLDVLEALEEPVINLYRENPDLIDAEVATAITWLIRTYNAEARGQTNSARSPNGLAGEITQLLQPVCESYLGRGEAPPPPRAGAVLEKLIAMVKPRSADRTITAPQLLICLRRLQSSIKFWTKQSGRQGYLDYVNQFLP